MVNNKLWFKAKLFGWGWYPATWEGWLVVGVYVALVTWIMSAADPFIYEMEMGWVYVTLPITALTLILIFISWKKGEKPGWRWGK